VRRIFIKEKFLILELGINSFAEPCYLVYDIQNLKLDRAIVDLRNLLQARANEDDLIARCRQKRIERVSLMNNALELAVSVRTCLIMLAY